MTDSRVSKGIQNARINLFFYIVFVFLSFFSRKIFLDSLGADFMGLSGTLSNILGFLSLAEMGVGSAVSYNLYKPLGDGNKQKIEELVSVFGFLYRKIGMFILGIGMIISLFIPLIFKNTIFSYFLIFFAFYSILISSLLSYFINYKQIILSADQKGYVVTGFLQGAGFVKILLQMFFAYYWANFYIWIVLELVFSFLACIILNWKIKITYPWLDASVKKGKLCFRDYHYILGFTKKVFIHKIKDFLLNQSDQILVFAFVSLKMVAYYGNYTLIITRVSSAFDSALNSIGASVGNLVAEGNKSKSIGVFWELVSLGFIVAGILVFSVYNLIEPFIEIWLGKEYVMDHLILVLLLVNVAIVQTRGAVDMFNFAFGHFADTWAAWCELVINIGVTLISAPFLGIVGILLGKIVSTIVIIIFWKPYYLFKVGFKLKYRDYWKKAIAYWFILLACFIICTELCDLIPIEAASSYLNWLKKAFLSTSVFCITYLTSLYLFTDGTRLLLKRLCKLIINKCGFNMSI